MKTPTAPPAGPGTAAISAWLDGLRPANLLGRLGLLVHARQLAKRFDQRQPRERLLLCAAVVAVAYLLADTLWLGPAFGKFRQARQARILAENTLVSLQHQASSLQLQSVQRAQHQQAELLDWRQRVRLGDTTLRSHEAALVGADRMVGLLEQLLARQGEVRVRALRSLGRQDLLAPSLGTSQAAATATATGQAPAGPSLYRHGVELVLEGGFADLLTYLRAIEALPQRVLFGSVNLKVEQHPRSVLTLRVYTLSRDANWLEI
jgi:MSHA biogenesis protein MshJ